MYARPVTLHIIKLLYINAMRRFMFTCAGTPLALPYQEFTKGMNPLAPSVRKGKRHVRNKAFLGKVHPMKRNDMQKRGNTHGGNDGHVEKSP